MSALGKLARLPPALLAFLALFGTVLPSAARADVTIEEQSTFDVTIIKAHGTATELTTTDKQRRDSTMHCEGFMSLLCGNAQSGEIIRLDRDVQWSLEPKKQEYRETPFLTPAQRLAGEQEAQAMLEKMKQCPAARNTAPGPDTSKCQMTPPKFGVNLTDQHATFAGHDARLTQVTMTQSCVNSETGDSCDTVIGMDAWLTQDQIAGLDDKRAFQKAYLHKLGLDDTDSLVQKQMRQFLAPYAAGLKQLSGKAGDFSGYPLKSAVRIAFGGEHCSSAKGQQQSASGDTSQAAGSGSSAPPTSLGSAANALGSKLIGGLFAKKKADSASGASNAPGPGGALGPGMVQAASFTVETTSISAGPIAPAQFDIPPSWKLVVPPPPKPAKEFTCPSS